MLKHQKIKLGISTFLLVLVFFLLGVYVGTYRQSDISKVLSVTNKETPTTITADFAPFWKAWNIINEKSPDASKLTDQNRVYGAISGLVGSLNDPYSVFFNPEDAKSFEDDIAGSFSGIGVEVGIKDKILTVIAPLKDSPGYKAGLKAGDKILKIDQTLTSDITIEKAVRLIHGEKGTTVTLTIFRDGERESREIKIVRDIINVPIVKTESKPDGVFVITLNSFSANSASLFQSSSSFLNAFKPVSFDKNYTTL